MICQLGFRVSFLLGSVGLIWESGRDRWGDGLCLAEVGFADRGRQAIWAFIFYFGFPAAGE